jgi:tRNA-specific 2-thiouridylase
MMLRLWSEPGKEDSNRCCSPDAMALARRVAARLGIPFYVVDAKQIFRETVVQAFLDGYAAGLTPNPCLACNRVVRWEFLFEHARAFGADFLATGHYARLRMTDDGRVELMRGLDESKDQSYVLHVIPQEKLKHALFPVGGYAKPQIRAIAAELNLPVSDCRDSQDLCFLAGEDYRDFLRRNAPELARPGPIVDREGRALGTHEGLAFYTIGQRKGLGLAGGEPLYVLEKDALANALIVGPEEQLGRSALTCGPVTWTSGRVPPEPFRATVKARYSARPAGAWVTPGSGDRAQVRFDQPQRDLTPGQAAVFYRDEIVLGGGLIQSVE